MKKEHTTHTSSFFKKALWTFLYGLVFLVVLAISFAVKLSSLTGIDATSFTLQKAATDAVRYTGEIERSTYLVPYITNDGTVDEREIILLRPKDATGEIPLVYIPHYEIDENTADFQQYMSHGWAVASAVFRSEYNGILAGDDLVFNNAALYALRHMEGVDNQRIAIVGGSAGGYTALMLNELQMGTCCAIANSPIANVYYNLCIYFSACDALNRASGITDIAMPVQLLITKSFRPNLSSFPNLHDADRFAALSPIGMAKCFSNPVAINHYTGDILVPVDQITKKYTYRQKNPAFPADFPIAMGEDYPGILSHSLEEEARQTDVSVSRYAVENQVVDMAMPVSEKLLAINIFDDGPMNPKGTHAAPGTTGNLDTTAYLEEMFRRTLRETEQLIPEKLLLLLERYQGKSVQLPAHENVNDEIYGSLRMYRLEIIQELSQYAENHSLEALEAAMEQAIRSAPNPQELTPCWLEIRELIGG